MRKVSLPLTGLGKNRCRWHNLYLSVGHQVLSGPEVRVRTKKSTSGPPLPVPAQEGIQASRQVPFRRQRPTTGNVLKQNTLEFKESMDAGLILSSAIY